MFKPDNKILTKKVIKILSKLNKFSAFDYYYILREVEKDFYYSNSYVLSSKIRTILASFNKLNLIKQNNAQHNIFKVKNLNVLKYYNRLLKDV